MSKENEEYGVYAHSNGETYVVNDKGNYIYDRKKLFEEKDEEPSVLAVPCDRAFVVAPEKALEFNNIKPNPELLKKMREATEKLTNLKVELEPTKYSSRVLKKVKKPE